MYTQQDRYRPLGLLVAAPLALALIVLALLQYYWVGRVAHGERERVRAEMQANAAQLSRALDQELAEAYMRLPLDALTLRERDWRAYARRFADWRAQARHPQLVAGVFLAELRYNGAWRLSRFDAQAQRFASGRWPEALHTLQQRLEAFHQHSAPGDSQLFPESSVADVPALIIPVGSGALLNPAQFEIENLIICSSVRPRGPAWQCDPLGEPPPRLAYTVVVLNQAYLEQELLPELAHAAFFDGTRLRYDLAVTSREPGQRLIYRSNPAWANGQQGDLQVELFGLGLTPAARGHWLLHIRHRDGSLDAAMIGLRRSNLTLGFGILLLLAISLLLLIRSTQRMQRLSRQRLELAAAISHELRTPLAIIAAASENLGDGIVRDPAQVQRYGATIQNESRRLSELVEQAIEFAGRQARGTRYDPQPLQIAALVDEALAALQPLLETKRATVECDLAPDLPELVADGPALRRALQNLIANAVKYGGSAGPIRVQARLFRARQGGEIQISVRDKGVGINRDELSLIFEPFYRGRSVATQIGGSGLGLSLVKTIVEDHGGRVSVESSPAQGSLFTIHLPVGAAA